MLVDAYEALRKQARGDSPTPIESLHGVAILLRKGMAAWMHACTVAAAEAVVQPAPASDLSLPTGLQHEVVDVLAAMVMTTLEMRA